MCSSCTRSCGGCNTSSQCIIRERQIKTINTKCNSFFYIFRFFGLPLTSCNISFTKFTRRTLITINKIINELGLNAIAYGYGSVWALYFDKIIPSNYRDITRYLRNGGKEKYTAYFRFMLNNGIFIPPGRVARNYIYQAHSDDDLQKTVDVTTRFLREFQSSLR